MPLYSLPALKNACVANGWQEGSNYLPSKHLPSKQLGLATHPIPVATLFATLFALYALLSSPSIPSFACPLSLPCPAPPLLPLSREGCEREGIFVVEGNERGREQELTGQEVTGREQEVTGKGRACFQFAFTFCFLTPRVS
jgi:hypothetical protein